MKGSREGPGETITGIRKGGGLEGWRKVVVVQLCSVQGRWTLRCWSLEQEADPAIAKQVHVCLQKSSKEILLFHG